MALALQRAASLSIAITGSSQGIGLDAAKRLLAEGHTIYHGCRSAARADAAVAGAGGGVPLVCDLADLASVRAFAASLPDDVDVLCLNAGVAPSTKAAAPARTADGFEACVGTNHLGHFALAELVAPRLAARRGRIVVTASSVHDPAQPGGAVYKDSKLCNVLFAREALARYPGVDVRSFNPGFIPSSGLFRAPREDNWLGATAFTLVAGLVGFAVPVAVGGARLAYVATADGLARGAYLSAETGSRAVTFADGFDDGPISPEGADAGLAARLWERSRELVA
ncbi:ubiquitinyl hydrolase [Aureococcus anophagefferens]|nr:ubiquitinyl hydrolase [Aureococcus anophagefferens]